MLMKMMTLLKILRILKLIKLLKKMSSLKNVSMKGKLILSFAFIMIVISVSAFYQFKQITNIKDQLAQQNTHMNNSFSAMNLKNVVLEMEILSEQLVITKSDESKAAYDALSEQFLNYVQVMNDLATTKEERNWRAMLKTVSTEYTNNYDQALALLELDTLNEEQLTSKLIQKHDLSQAHKTRIFELVDNFNTSFEQKWKESESTSLEMLDQTYRVFLILLSVVLVITLVISFFVIRYLSTGIGQLQKAMKQMADGNLSVKIKHTSNDELGKLSRYFNYMLDQFGAMILHTREVAANLQQYAEHFHSVSKTNAAHNNEMVYAIHEITNGAEEQMKYMEQSTTYIHALDEQMEHIAASSDKMKSESDSSLEKTTLGMQSMQQLQHISVQSENQLQQMSASMQQLIAQTNEIYSMTSKVNDIASQTNILSINASIIAAQAKKEGKQFSVISDEIRTLAHESKQTSDDIVQTLEQLQEKINDVERNMHKTKEDILVQNEALQDTSSHFQSIKSVTEHVSEHMKVILKETNEAKARKNQVVSSIDEISAIAQHTTGRVQQMNSTSIEQNKRMQEAAVQTDKMREMSNQLLSLVQHFRME
ncbi:methyl-accepting chemotaxis protein [Longirhabdus pacifica]|uniref:methyl-accepting chemotaxis protein n=1 Tax=Longirhabdus pacifica TaxID=2305227 RepID=UPI00100918AC|nr:methyl-accepting chemotaxis protein [Longirhabdus pacifica]